MELLNEIWQGSGLYQITGGQAIMLLICLGLLYLGIARKFEPLLLVTIGFGGLLSNIPGVEIATGDGLLHLFYIVGIERSKYILATHRADIHAHAQTCDRCIELIFHFDSERVSGSDRLDDVPASVFNSN